MDQKEEMIKQLKHYRSWKDNLNTLRDKKRTLMDQSEDLINDQGFKPYVAITLTCENLS